MSTRRPTRTAGPTLFGPTLFVGLFPDASPAEVEAVVHPVFRHFYATLGHPRRRERVITALRALAVDPFPGGRTPPRPHTDNIAWGALTALVGEEEVHRAIMSRAGMSERAIDSALHINRTIVANFRVYHPAPPLD
jgi:hypothetical protein